MAQNKDVIRDIESGLETNHNNNITNRQLYPTMLETPQLRWAFIRKVYCIISVQMCITVAVAASVVFYKPIPHFFRTTTAGICTYVVILILSILTMIALYFFHKKHPLNYILLFFYTILISSSVGVACAFTKGRIILLAVILTATVVVGLTLYTFVAVKRGQDFSFLGPFLFAALLVLLMFAIIQIEFRLGKMTRMIFSVIIAIIFSAFIIYDTESMIKRFTYDDYILAAVMLYVDIINLFLAILGIARLGD